MGGRLSKAITRAIKNEFGTVSQTKSKMKCRLKCLTQLNHPPRDTGAIPGPGRGAGILGESPADSLSLAAYTSRFRKSEPVTEPNGKAEAYRIRRVSPAEEEVRPARIIDRGPLMGESVESKPSRIGSRCWYDVSLRYPREGLKSQGTYYPKIRHRRTAIQERLVAPSRRSLQRSQRPCCSKLSKRMNEIGLFPLDEEVLTYSFA